MEKVREIVEFNVVAYLLASGFQQASKPKFDHGMVSFYFEDTPELNKAIATYYMREAQMDPLTMAESVRRVKSIIIGLKIADRAQKQGVDHE